jgi:hypothetical protein
MPRKRPDLAARNRASARHGHTRDRDPSGAWRSWHSMMQRAHTGTSKDAARYLGRGITVCDRWLVFENFLADMGERPAGASIERTDNARGYEPGNCRWATPKEQARNRRSAFLVTALGRTQHLADWALETGMSHQAIRHRLRSGWPPDEAVTVPVDHRNRRSTNA